MKGCITKKGSKYWLVLDLGRDINGKRIIKWHSSYDKKPEAEKARIEILHSLQNNTYINPEKLLLGQYLRQWLSDYEVNLAVKTIEGYRVNIEGHIIPCLGQIPLQKLQPVHIQQFYKEKLKNGRLDGKGGLSPKSVLYIHRVLREALNHAVKMQLIPRNVADMVETPKQRNTFKASFLNEKQVQELLLAFRETEIFLPVLLAVGVGLRRGEALGLQWKDIDFESNSITVNRSLLPSKNGVIFHEPKTEKSNRVVVVSKTIIEELQKKKDKQESYKQLLGKAYKNNDLVNCYNDGSPLNPASFSHSFSKILEKNELPHIRFHDLRHTNATLMLKSNIPAKVASERLGHSNIGITLDLYSHVMKEMQEEAAMKLDNIFSNSD